MRRFVAVGIALCLGCGNAATDVVDDVPAEEQPPPLTGTVIASGAFDIDPVSVTTITEPGFLIARRFEGNLPADLAPASGKLLVLSVREVRNALRCPTAGFITECATMVVLEQDGTEPGSRPGRLSFLGSKPVTYYPWGDHTLMTEAEST